MTDEPDVLSFVLGTASFTDLIDNLELLGRIGRQDERIAARVKHARDGVARLAGRPVSRARSRRGSRRLPHRRPPSSVASSPAWSRAGTRSSPRGRTSRRPSPRSRRIASRVLAEIDALEEQSAELAAQIRQAQQQAAASSAPTIVPPSGSGILGWPVSGPVVSGFGMRSGRMHEGIDITCRERYPGARGGCRNVIHAGWLGGYGNLVVVDHGGGLSTAYAHNSSYASSVGQSVAAGQVISYAGSTGDSSGPHVHFEVRVNGSRRGPARLPVGRFREARELGAEVPYAASIAAGSSSALTTCRSGSARQRSSRPSP